MPVNLEHSVIIKNQRSLIEINKIIKKCKKDRWNLEKKKNELRLNFPQETIVGKIETLNNAIDKINSDIERLKEKRNKIEVRAPIK